MQHLKADQAVFLSNLFREMEKRLSRREQDLIRGEVKKAQDILLGLHGTPEVPAKERKVEHAVAR